jgi:Sec-independent protein translocase protein TatA
MNLGLAYFTDSMGDEFKKAMEEAMKELEEEEQASKNKPKVRKSQQKPKIKRLSGETKRKLK